MPSLHPPVVGNAVGDEQDERPIVILLGHSPGFNGFVIQQIERGTVDYFLDPEDVMGPAFQKTENRVQE